jgi:hypothetical protein
LFNFCLSNFLSLFTFSQSCHHSDLKYSLKICRNNFSDSEASNPDTYQTISVLAKLLVIGRRAFRASSDQNVGKEIVVLDVRPLLPDAHRHLLLRRRLCDLSDVRRTFRTPTFCSRRFRQPGFQSRSLSERSQVSAKRTLPNAEQTNLVRAQLFS